MPPAPTDLHRVMNQAFLARRHIPDDIALELYKRSITAVRKNDPGFAPSHAVDRRGMRSFFQECSNILESQDLRMEIRSVVDEQRLGGEVFVLVNTDGTDESKYMSDFEPLQISYFRLVTEAIITSYPANSIGSNAALNLSSKLKGTMTKAVAENVLRSFVTRGWLVQSRRGRFALAPRAIVELESWLMGEFEDYIQRCARCTKIVLSGVICTAEDCEAHIHGSCHASLMSAQARCPKCKESFTTNPPSLLGEKAVSREQDDFGQVRGKRKRPSAVARGRRRGDEDENEEEEESDDLEEEEGEGGGESSRGATQGGSRSRRRREEAGEEEEAEDELVWCEDP